MQTHHIKDFSQTLFRCICFVYSVYIFLLLLQLVMNACCQPIFFSYPLPLIMHSLARYPVFTPKYVLSCIHLNRCFYYTYITRLRGRHTRISGGYKTRNRKRNGTENGIKRKICNVIDINFRKTYRHYLCMNHPSFALTMYMYYIFTIKYTKYYHFQR